MTENERIFYDQCIDVSEKKSAAKDAMAKDVQDGRLTSSEVEFLSAQATTRVEELQSRGQPVPQTLRDRQARLRDVAKNPIPPPPLKHQAELGKLWKRAAPLMHLNSCG